MYFYLNKENLLNGEVVIVFQTENQIPNYKEITNFGELVEFKGESIPANWEYSKTEDTMYSIDDKPSPFHILKNKKWIVEDKEGFREYCDKKVDRIKAEILKYGFDYEIDGEKHRQKCRFEDISLMGTTMTFLLASKIALGKDDTVVWYFEDNFQHIMNLQELIIFASYGKGFIDGVYSAENYFKTLEEPKLINKDDYLAKIKEFMAGGN
ncbi:hypothetical protein [Fusobacterium periodonticum]|jgi:hypothetical protein fuD12_02769|uniref:DUF4376 domain-containing protein n=1 Tax=Fusobacterium periodonticum D10 TaxID=620833 RepID=K1HD63_9FUSO|nr:hypothetical protein [Fusobacterium periodonticum]EKA93408.1 hypothetical protein FPOG_00313 [Fusobacterium periodonticum D10]